MPASYLFRLDDIAPNMNWGSFLRIKALFLKHGVTPLLSIIPDNQDPKLLSYEFRQNFWEEMKNLIDVHGFTPGLHGLQHVIRDHVRNWIPVFHRSEFSGFSREKQCEMLEKGLVILKFHGIFPKVFVAPAHGFDENTLQAIAKTDIRFVSDGIGLFPSYYENLFMLPQIAWKPRRFFCGYITFCLHPNTITNEEINAWDLFLTNEKKNILSFSDYLAKAPSLAKLSRKPSYRLMHRLFAPSWRLLYTWRRDFALLR